MNINIEGMNWDAEVVIREYKTKDNFVSIHKNDEGIYQNIPTSTTREQLLGKAWDAMEAMVTPKKPAKPATTPKEA